MTIGVYLGDKHCLTDYGMYLTDVKMDHPAPQTTYIEVPGRNGALDLTEALSGEVKYDDGTITLTFQSSESLCGKSWSGFIGDLMPLHGEKTEITFDDDPDWHFSGRCTVSGTPAAGKVYEATIAVRCDPFEYDDSGDTKVW